MIDRGIIKWQPFNSCFSSEKMLKEITNKKNRLDYPILSDDQLSIIEENILTAYHLKESISILYFYDGKKLQITGKINYIDINNKEIYINNKKIYFKQIINII